LPNQNLASIHLAEFPQVESDLDLHLLDTWEKIFAIRDNVLKQLEVARTEKLIGSGLEAKVRLSVDDENFEFLTPYRFDLRYIFIVSNVELFESDTPNIEITKAEGQKCERCWNYSRNVGVSERYPTTCERCVEALIEIER
jgi:isoleucyl-tRNA synthetase